MVVTVENIKNKILCGYEAKVLKIEIINEEKWPKCPNIKISGDKNSKNDYLER